MNEGRAMLIVPRVDSFFVLITLAAYSCPVLFWMHRRTIENAPLQSKQRHG